jgi:PAS domain S-box-containing protein
MLETGDGSRRWFRATGKPITANHIHGAVIVMRDITDERVGHTSPAAR